MKGTGDFEKDYYVFGSFEKTLYLCPQIERYMDSNTTTYKGNRRHSSVPFFSYGTHSQGEALPVVLPLNDEKSQIKIALDKLSYLKAGWDGLDAAPIAKDVIYNVLQLLSVSDNQVWRNWSLEPNINGTLILRSRSRTSAISLGSDTFSFYIKNGQNITGKDDVPFSAESVVGIMQSLNN